jgi:hypothetical protein
MARFQVELGEVSDRAGELEGFLRERVEGEVKVAEGRIELEGEGLRKRVLKAYLKRFLHRAGLRDQYRVLVAGETLSIRPRRRVREVVEEEEES